MFCEIPLISQKFASNVELSLKKETDILDCILKQYNDFLLSIKDEYSHKINTIKSTLFTKLKAFVNNITVSITDNSNTNNNRKMPLVKSFYQEFYDLICGIEYLGNIKEEFDNDNKQLFLLRYLNNHEDDKLYKEILIIVQKIQKMLEILENHINNWIKIVFENIEINRNLLMDHLKNQEILNEDNRKYLEIVYFNVPNNVDSTENNFENWIDISRFLSKGKNSDFLEIPEDKIIHKLKDLQILQTQFLARIELGAQHLIEKINEQISNQLKIVSQSQNNSYLIKLKTVLEIDNHYAEVINKLKYDMDHIEDILIDSINDLITQDNKLLNKKNFDQLKTHLKSEIEHFSILSNNKPILESILNLSDNILNELQKINQSDIFKDKVKDFVKNFERNNIVFKFCRSNFKDENFSDIIKDFLESSKLKFNQIVVTKNTTKHLQPLYLCYIDQNKIDFYLIEMNYPNRLAIYYTNQYAEKVLHIHLQKLIGISFNISLCCILFTEPNENINNRDMFLQYYINRSLQVEEDDDLFSLYKLYIYWVIFLLNNSVKINYACLNITSKDLCKFYNYCEEYQKNKEQFIQKQQNNTFFHIRFPFRDYRLNVKEQEYIKTPMNNLYLALEFEDESAQSLIKYQPLFLDAKDINNKENLELSKLRKFSKKWFSRPSLNFDNVQYLNDYIKKRYKHDLTKVRIWDKLYGNNLWKIFKGDQIDHDNIVGRFVTETSQCQYAFVFVSSQEISLGVFIIDFQKNMVFFIDIENSNMNGEQFNEKQRFIHFLINSLEKDAESFELFQLNCDFKDEESLQFFQKFYFPYTFFLDKLQVINNQSKLFALDIESILPSLNFFIKYNLFERNTDIIHVHSYLYHHNLKHQYLIKYDPYHRKFNSLRLAIKSLINEMYTKQHKGMLYAFSFIGLATPVLYYLYMEENKIMKSLMEESNIESPVIIPSYNVKLFSCYNNQAQDDLETFKVLFGVAQELTTLKLVFENAYKVNVENNPGIIKDPDLINTALVYMLQKQIPIEEGFREISSSISSFYEVINGVIDQIATENQNAKFADLFEDFNIDGNSANTDVDGCNSVVTTRKSVIIRYKSMNSDDNDLTFDQKLQANAIDILNKMKLNIGAKEELSSFIQHLKQDDYQKNIFDYVLDIPIELIIDAEKPNKNIERNINAIVEKINKKMLDYEEIIGEKISTCKIYIVLPQSQMTMIKSNEICLVEIIVNLTICNSQINYYSMKSLEKINDIPRWASLCEEISKSIRSNENQEIIALVKSKVIPIQFTGNILSIMTHDYNLLIKLVLYKVSKVDIDKLYGFLDIESLDLISMLNQFAENFFKKLIDLTKISENYIQLSTIFLNPSILNIETGYLSFLNGILNATQLHIVGTYINKFKKDYSLCKTLKNGIFMFNMMFKNTMKHYLIYMNRNDDNDKVVQIRVYTNRVSDDDSTCSNDEDDIIDKLIKDYIIEDSDKANITFDIKSFCIYTLAIPNHLFGRYLDITIFLIGNSICNRMHDIDTIINILAKSSIHYLFELIQFNDKCQSTQSIRLI